ncbi:DUF3955 domain-containing protein [Enterococcus sp. DIV0242_7C1]|uniref:HTH cro/C1-type domain-containing protein n=1 Tax=Candidatus Enterococcus dunnyi TaxID=1834192 RepID=A0A200JC12_9ENTE|nr:MULTISPECIES: DUF3955 domain-containing protein [unclassified Enterococcus]MBO0471024.1 DUF3955 domain-containing protein [Enterococcus sp. DIV0242_7C1]OUZ34753.1 hypothetical protein A5889_000228 [Enterococcus sp. 9D6_DIV0238]
MEFGAKIKVLRTENQLTQEQFASRLNVTRQAVSNWENNRNLPDLEMLILIARSFHISLDDLILGGNTVNNITEKLIQDGSETRRARFNMITTLIGAFLLFFGFACFFIKANSVEYIDQSGILHENFYLLPIGFFFIFTGIIVFLVIGINYVRELIKRKV